MLSDSMLALTQGNSVIRAMFEEGKRLEAVYGRENVFDFSLGNPNFPAPGSVSEAIRGVLSDTPPTEIHGYMPNAGFVSVREKIAGSINRRFKTDYSSANVIMSVGAAGAINTVLKTLINPGDEIISFSPFFVEYRNYAGNYGGVLIPVPMNPPTFQPDIEALDGKITEKTKAVIINSPNNPTGVIYPAAAIKNIADVLYAKQREYGHPIVIISDEPYRELCYTDTIVPWIPDFYDNTIVCYSWSKSLSLPGERIGYILTPNTVSDFENVYSALTIATRVLGFVNAPSLMQLAVARVLDTDPDITPYRANRDLLYNALSKLGFDCTLPEGAFYLWVRAPGGDDAAFCEKAKAHNILVVPGTSFFGPGYVRIAYCVSKDMIERSLPGFRKLAELLV